MNCQRCGNEVQPEEIFCGQCGTATISSASPTNMVNSVPSGREDLPAPYKNASPPPQQIRTPRPQTPPPHAQTKNLFSPPGGLFTSGHPSQETPEPQQGTVGAKHALPRSSHSGQGANGQGYGYGRPIIPAIPPQPQKQQSSATVLIVSICVVVGLVSIIAITTLFLRGSSESTAHNGSMPSRVAQQPTPVPTATPTPQDTPTPTVVPTPLPDPGFAWCGPTCTNYGFSVEYPVGWQLGGTPTNNGIQFTNPAQPDQTAMFKAIGPTGGSAGDILNSELQTNFMTKPSYIPPQGTGVTTLGGATWLDTTVYYQSVDQQREHVVIYTIVYQSKGYSIEIQAPDPDGQQFTLVYTTYYAAMLSKFSFVQ